jgi:hypothetical protein
MTASMSFAITARNPEFTPLAMKFRVHRFEYGGEALWTTVTVYHGL